VLNATIAAAGNVTFPTSGGATVTRGVAMSIEITLTRGAVLTALPSLKTDSIPQFPALDPLSARNSSRPNQERQNNRPNNTPADPRDVRVGRLPFENFLMNRHQQASRFPFRANFQSIRPVGTQSTSLTVPRLPLSPPRSSPAAARFVADSPLEGDGFEPVWGFSCQTVVWVVLTVFCSERERPFFAPSPAIRFAERAEGVKGPKR